ncbi:amidohydrolase [Microvirga aerophila]|uniref:Aminobenzoyl-glutamate utilization protein B n=1 Tax=Microvirga aerophila TaxID=670291 RepID=A0A512BZG2_9HYPH|nr:amidohydrolase [Microvirga aerophila]GEO17349.1 aminobenzoyl-glutamate utilization protein B [Microvirga aerophila]
MADIDLVRAEWRALKPDIEGLFTTLWNCPEMPGLEYRSVEWLTGLLRRHSFSVEIGSGGVPTAFVARRGSGAGPCIGILAEYDALASLDNEAVPYRKGTGRKPGHGCGHNHIGPANTGAGIAAAAVAERLGLAGEIVVIGCPAEEIGWGKIALQQAGIFDELDVILTSHGDYQNGSLSRPCHAVASGEFVFRGDSAHAGMGVARNALKAAEEALAAFEAVRARHFPGISSKHVFRVAGVMPGVMPEEVRVWCSVRHTDLAPMMAAYEGMKEIFIDVAGQSDVGCEEKFVAACRGYLANDTVGRLLDECLRMVGPPQWTEAEIAWMMELSSAASPGKPFDLHREIGYFDNGIDYYGQDDGDASWIVPLGRVNWAYPTNVPIHHWAWTALSGHPAGSPGPLMASEALAIAAVRLISNPDLVSKANAELKQRVGDEIIKVVPPGINDVMAEDPIAFWEARW